jgi:hypothetical protein
MHAWIIDLDYNVIEEPSILALNDQIISCFDTNL